MLKKIFLLLVIQISLFGTSLHEKIAQGKQGDYIVTLQNRTISALIIRYNDRNSLILDEVSLPGIYKKEYATNWPDWISKGFPKNSAHFIYHIDIAKQKMLSCYDCSTKQFIQLDSENNPLNSFFALDLLKLEKEQMRKIGPSPQNGEMDHRPIWKPPFYYEGAKKAVTFDAYKTIWPKDSTELSNKQLTVYFMKDFCFPHWIEVSNHHLSLVLKAIDSGKNSDLNFTDYPLIRLFSIPKINYEILSFNIFSILDPEKIQLSLYGKPDIPIKATFIKNQNAFYEYTCQINLKQMTSLEAKDQPFHLIASLKNDENFQYQIPYPLYFKKETPIIP
ncbi:MAG TPA: hypothetical protein P5048_02840 [Chlamydiales bacterium]|nr:hypothetical protein [Chlamydiales bacterium]